MPYVRTIHADDDVVTICPRGELDLDTAPCSMMTFETCGTSASPALVVNLRDLSFIDSAGIHLLLRWARCASRRRFGFRVIPGPERVRLVFALTGVLDGERAPGS